MGIMKEAVLELYNYNLKYKQTIYKKIKLNWPAVTQN